MTIDTLKRFMFEKDSLMKDLGFLVYEPNKFYEKALSPCKSVFVEYVGLQFNQDNQPFKAYTVMCYTVTKHGCFEKIIIKNVPFHTAYRRVKGYIDYLEKNTKNEQIGVKK